MTDTKSKVQLYVAPAVRTFAKDKLHELRDYLHDSEKSTALVDIGNAMDLQLHNNGKTKVGNFRMTQLMFKQCAQRLGQGTSRFLPSLAGMEQPTDPPTLCDAAFAVGCWNRLVKLRVAPLQKYRMIRNQKTGQLEGLVGNKQQYLNNHEILERALQECENAHGASCEFYGAKMLGRSLTMWFRHTAPIMALTADGITTQFYGGYYFTVQETSGNAMRGTTAIFSTHGVCLASFRQFGARATRNQVGEQFDVRVAQLFSTVFNGKFERELLCTGVKALSETTLGYHSSMLREERDKRTEHIIRALRSCGVQKDLATSILSDVLHRGSDTPDIPALQQLSILFAKRSVFDLFVYLLRTARTRNAAVRERLELLAYRILVGRVTF